MRTVLEINSGPAAGRKVLLRMGQVLRVGRTDLADLAVEHDGQMSAEHFAVLADASGCYAEDLGSTNGTMLNGQPLGERTAVHDADEIRAGQTSFTIVVEGTAPKQQTFVGGAAVPVFSAAANAALGRRGPASSRRSGIPAEVERCESGLDVHCGSVTDISAAELANRMIQGRELYLMVDFNRLGDPRPKDLETPDYLFDWLDTAAETVSPVVFAGAESITWPTMVDAGWGRDAVIVLLSALGKNVLLEHLRACLHPRADGDEQTHGILAYCWPSALAALLRGDTSGFAERFLVGVDAAMVEQPGRPDTWQVFGGTATADLLKRAGCELRRADEVTAKSADGPG
jgi:type III secretion system (T3SS) inner membrane Yop/YscD-like protein